MKTRWLALVLVGLSVSGVAGAGTQELNAVLYPEGKKVPVAFETLDRVPKAKLAGEVTVSNNQAMITVQWSALEPALLFGGDLNCWVLWAVTPDGLAENLGELPVREDRSGKGSFATPHKIFALMVTAEPLVVVRNPSELIAFVSLPAKDKLVKNSTFAYADFRTIYTDRERESIASMKYTDKTPVDLVQARNAIVLMDRFGAEKYAEQPARDARVAIGQAEDAYAGRVGDKKDVPELARRATALVSEAVRTAAKQIDAEQAQAAEAKRLSELTAAKEATQTEREARAEAETARAEVEAALADVQRQRTALEADRAKLQGERDALARRLSGALGAVAQTQNTGRGLVVSLSGEILFDTGESALKQDAQLSLAKLAGILLMIPDTRITIEGHTDATGSAETNEKLSHDRAASVMDFLRAHGLQTTRMSATGLGPSSPVASNDTPEGRAKNRRVEIVIPSGS